ncbi:cytochrome P450 [Roseomonas xinghualingensis]|uniref:cytochrome P450 n=1 Tax=Roseomonas xinghualingensis TaxID=2986475 RepID=UPI0021F13758|nr:cytochrome P450 [Roseomonas sp. SXEYE001]MCV4210385.1 cytochrome P450 [Roseomonas sp. SXEYE001]
MAALKTGTHQTLPRASVMETLSFFSSVVLPLLGKGVILRRPPMVELAQRLGLDGRALRTVQGLRDRHGEGPLLLPVPFHPYALILVPGHATRVLAESPEPFATASDEKHAALSHFDPHGVLISGSRERALRRPYNEAVLDTPCPEHRLAERFLSIVEEEAARLVSEADERGELDWGRFASVWWQMARRVVLGDGARDDHALADSLARLRGDANWAFLHPKRRRLQEHFFARLEEHLQRAEPDSLAAIMATIPAAAGVEPAQQVPQWLFALDAPARATFRTLALLGTHPVKRARAEAEIASGSREMPFLRACVLDTLRLWPTTPVVLRQATADVEWENGILPRGAGVIVYTPFFHRDEARLPQAHRFAPETWLGSRPEDRALIPFSDGSARCPGRNLSLLLSSAMLEQTPFIRVHSRRL